jgi:hypothetical protein
LDLGCVVHFSPCFGVHWKIGAVRSFSFAARMLDLVLSAMPHSIFSVSGSAREDSCLPAFNFDHRTQFRIELFISVLHFQGSWVSGCRCHEPGLLHFELPLTAFFIYAVSPVSWHHSSPCENSCLPPKQVLLLSHHIKGLSFSSFSPFFRGGFLVMLERCSMKCP